MPNRNVVAANGDGGGSGGGGGALDTAAAALNLPTLPPWIARRQKSMVTAGSLSLLGAFLTFVCFNQTELVIDLLVLEMKSTIGQAYTHSLGACVQGRAVDSTSVARLLRIRTA